LVLHNAGDEYPHAYQHGPYKYLSAQPPKLLVARNSEEFNAGIEVMGSVLIQGSKVLLHKSAKDVMNRLSL
jgi:hypothetical protein